MSNSQSTTQCHCHKLLRSNVFLQYHFTYQHVTEINLRIDDMFWPETSDNLSINNISIYENETLLDGGRSAHEND